MESINRDKPKKLYIQLFEIIREKIEGGEWGVGEQIPVEEELCRIYKVSKATIRLAVLELARQGYLIRQQGRGTFVCKKAPALGMRMSADVDEFMVEGAPLTIQVLAQTLMTPVDDLGAKLEAPDETHVIYIRRLALAGSEPVLLAESYVPYHFCPELLREELGSQPLTEVLEKKFQIQITGIRLFIDLAHASEREAILLGVPKDAPLLLAEQHFYAEDGQVMYMRAVKRLGKFRFSREFTNK